MEVRFKDLAVSANVFVGARGMPGLHNDALSMLEVGKADTCKAFFIMLVSAPCYATSLT